MHNTKKSKGKTKTGENKKQDSNGSLNRAG